MSESLPPPPPPPGVTGPPPPPGWTPPPTPPSPDGGSKTGLLIGIVVAVLAALGVGAFFLFRDGSSGAASEDTDPDLTISDVTIPEITIPEITIPDITVPDITIPDITIPDITIPDITIPDFTIPDITLPADDPAPGDTPPATQEPDGLGDDPQLDSLAQDCYDGDMQACDNLYQESPVNSDYQTYGDTCAGRQPALTQRFCINTFPN